MCDVYHFVSFFFSIICQQAVDLPAATAPSEQNNLICLWQKLTNSHLGLYTKSD